MPSTGPGIEVCSGGCKIIDGLLLSASFTFIHLLNPKSYREPNASLAMPEHSHLYAHTYIKSWYISCKDFGGKNSAVKGSP